MKIKWALNELKKYSEEPLQISGQVDLEQHLQKRDEQILAASPIQLDGVLAVEELNEYLVDLHLHVTLTLPSSRSLTPVEVELSIPFSETYLAPGHLPDPEKYGEDEIVIELESEVLDLQKPLEDSILTAIPSQVLTEEEQQSNLMPSGNEWEVISEEDHHAGLSKGKSSEEDSPFAALKDLFPEED
jgi:uncharacterized protein